MFDILVLSGLCLYQARLAGRGIVFSTGSFVCLFVCYQTCKHDILKTSRPILVPIGTHGPRGKGVKLSTLGVQRLRSHKARDGFGGLTGHHFRPP